MRILAIDPGPVESAWVVYDSDTGEIIEKAKEVNETAIQSLHWQSVDACAIEMIASYGMAVGATVFETCVWIGRFAETWERKNFPLVADFVYRKDVKTCLCGSTKAKDANIRQAIIDRYPATGGGKTPQIGTKAKPGPLYGMKSDIWAALAVAITYAEKDHGTN